MKKIAFFNQKGGVAKTTSAVNVAAMLAKSGNKVLLIDTDGQGNASNYLLSFEPDVTLIDILNGENINDAVNKAMIETRGGAKPKYVGIDVVASDRKMYAVENTAFDAISNIIDVLSVNKYDFVIIDCPPALNHITVSVMCAVEYIFVPITVDLDSMSGYAELVTTVQNINERGYNNVKIGGAFLTQFNVNGSYDKYILSEAKNVFENDLLNTQIRRSADIKVSRHFCRPLAWFKTKGNAATDYSNLTEEIIKKCQKNIDKSTKI